jgi:hypothetical protein
MDEAALLGGSARERALYAELLAVYRGLADGLAAGTADAAALDAGRGRADALVRALRDVAAALAPHRLTAAAVPAPVRALWAESADLAVQALAANAELGRRAREDRAAVATALAGLGRGRAGVAGYRAAATGAPRIADRHA